MQTNFCGYVECCLLPYCPAIVAIPSSVVILGNASIHHVKRVVHLIEETGAMVLFLPPYSPDIMPIEESFSKVDLHVLMTP